MKPGVPMPISLLIRGIAWRRISRRTSAAPASSASAALSTADAPTPTTTTRLVPGVPCAVGVPFIGAPR